MEGAHHDGHFYRLFESLPVVETCGDPGNDCWFLGSVRGYGPDLYKRSTPLGEFTPPSINRASFRWLGLGGRRSFGRYRWSELRFPATGEAKRQFLPLVPWLCADGYPPDDGPLLSGCCDESTKVTPLRGSSTAAVLPVVRGT